MQTPTCITTVIAAIGVLGTWFIFAAAIWGERIRSRLFKPRLRVELIEPKGDLITETIIITEGQSQEHYQRPARYYKIAAISTYRWPVAHNVQVVITRLERKGPDRRPITIWTGEIQ